MYRPLLSVTRSLFSRELRTAPGPLLAEKFINSVQILGRLGGDPRVLVQDEQRQLVFFDVVTNEIFKKTQEDGSVEQMDKATWHSFVVRRPGLREYVAKYLVKGSRILCNGSLQNRSMLGQDGKEFRSTNIVLHDVVIVDDFRKRNTSHEMENEIDAF